MIGKERIPRRSFLVPQVNLFLGAPDLIVPFLIFSHPSASKLIWESILWFRDKKWIDSLPEFVKLEAVPEVDHEDEHGL